MHSSAKFVHIIFLKMLKLLRTNMDLVPVLLGFLAVGHILSVLSGGHHGLIVELDVELHFAVLLIYLDVTKPDFLTNRG